MTFSDIVTSTTILTPEEVADFLKCEPVDVVVAYCDGYVKGFKVCSDEVRFREQDVVEWLSPLMDSSAITPTVDAIQEPTTTTDFFISTESTRNLGTIYDRRTEMAVEFYAKAKALGAEVTMLRLGDESVPAYEVAMNKDMWGYPSAILAITEDGCIYEATIKENEAGNDECLLVSNPLLFCVADLNEFFNQIWLAMAARLSTLGTAGVENSYVAECVSHHLTTMTDDPSRHIVAAAAGLVAEHYSERLADGTTDWIDETSIFNEVLDLTQRKRKNNFVTAAVLAIGEDMLFADGDAATEFDRRIYSNHNNKQRLVRLVAGRALWLLKRAGYPTDCRLYRGVTALPAVITEAVV